MRQGMAEAERSSGKKGAVPITVRQLEAIIRISGNKNRIGASDSEVWIIRFSYLINQESWFKTKFKLKI